MIVFDDHYVLFSLLLRFAAKSDKSTAKILRISIGADYSAVAFVCM